MKILTPVLVLVVATFLLTVALIASVLAPPFGLNSRDVLVLAFGIAGVILGAMAVRRFVHIHRSLIAH